MLGVGQPVDDGHVGVLGQLLDVGLGEGADHDRVDVAREHPGRVLDRLAAPELQVGGREVEAYAAELGDADLERDARSRRRLLEEHGQCPAGEELVGIPLCLRTLELVGQVERRCQLLA